jgi:hypothetical protein
MTGSSRTKESAAISDFWASLMIAVLDGSNRRWLALKGCADCIPGQLS